jgi:N6-adenosine-specific RNA methylase IME4
MIQIDNEFRDLLPPLSEEERAILEASLIADGCRDSLVLWNDILIDGHNRYTICSAHNIPFETVLYDFADRDAVKLWMIRNQFSRRNLNAYQRSELALLMEGIFQAKAKENLVTSTGGNDPRPLPTLAKAGIIDTRKETAKIAGVSKGTLHKAKTIKAKADDDTKEQLRRGEVSINQVYQQVQRDEKKEVRAKQLETHIDNLDVESKKYRIIYADPPWKYNEEQHTTLGDVHTVTLGAHYPSMSISELCELPVRDLANDNAVLFLWVTSPLLAECFELIDAWGFKYKTSMIWDKVKHNVGNYVSVRHELLLICTRGSCTPDNRKLYDSVQESPRTAHSVKPELFRHIIDDIYPHGNRIELFRRGDPISNWDIWGNEANER